MANEDYDYSEIERQLREAAAQKGVTYDQSDLEGIKRNTQYDVGGSSFDDALQNQMSVYDRRAVDTTPDDKTGGSPAQAWNNSGGGSGGGGGIFPNWYQELMTRQVGQQEADRAENKGRADAMYSTLNDRASQGLNVNAQDPIIKGQVDAFGATQERSRRNYLSDVAESSGPFANMRGEQRMTAEKAGQGTAAFQSELIGREQTARRDEIQNALATQGAMLSGDQNRNLQAQLAQMNQAIAETQAQTSRTSVDNQFSLGQQGLDLQRMLGMGSLSLQGRGLSQGNDQFLRELALRQWQVGDNSDYQWANLGG